MFKQTLGKKGGWYCYLITPFDDDGDVDHGVLERYVDAIIECGADGVTCIATTTEGPYLTETERFTAVEAVCNAANSRVPVNVGVGALATRQVLHFAEHAQKFGAATLMLEMQTLLPEIDFKAVHRHYKEIAESCSVPIRLYNIPRVTHFDLHPELIAEMSDIDGIDSIKDATGTAERIRDIRTLTGDRFAFFSGLHFVMLDSYKFGAIGSEVAAHPLIAKKIAELHRLLKTNEIEAGTKLFGELEPLFTFFRNHGVTQSIKTISTWSDINLGKPRRPLSELSKTQVSELKTIVKKLGCL
jgi:dihydrodipicolinate synthase/N-acetylneuraminate lyase